MKALSMMQPYAHLFALGYLTIDDRSWPTSFRGMVAIHASKRFDARYYDFIRNNTNWRMPDVDGFDQGGIVGVATLVNCLPPAKNMAVHIDLRRAHFGAPGFFGFVFEAATPVPYLASRGNRGLFDLTPDDAATLLRYTS